MFGDNHKALFFFVHEQFNIHAHHISHFTSHTAAFCTLGSSSTTN